LGILLVVSVRVTRDGEKIMSPIKEVSDLLVRVQRSKIAFWKEGKYETFRELKTVAEDLDEILKGLWRAHNAQEAKP
jgi:hypothetical protein